MFLSKLKKPIRFKNARKLKVKFASVQGQSTVEYAIVFAALLIIVVALGALMNVVSDGVFVEHAKTSASHNIEDSAGGMSDVFAY
jgi:hypothetical protein